MAPPAYPLLPSSSLPHLSTLETLTEKQILSALQGLSALYCPLPVSVALKANPGSNTISDGTATPLLDSGYTSGTEDDTDRVEQKLTTLRADGFERSFVERWVTGFIAKATELPGLSSEDALDTALEHASLVLESFVARTLEEEEKEKDNSDFSRDFSFVLSPSNTEQTELPITIRLNDGLAGTNSKDSDDVGLQSWGASILVSGLMCETPERFCLTQATLGTSPRVIELGAGTGLVSLVLGAILPRLGVTQPQIIATDYHPLVLENLRTNIDENFHSSDHVSVQATLLDWSSPIFEPPLERPAEMLIATDVIYAPEHAVWLRDCATQLLGPDGIFWLVATVRQNGRFEGISNTVEAAFTSEDRPRGKDGRQLTILQGEKLEKQSRIGRGDESGYKMFRIGWA
ncbi:methyltransferase domain-containing protein [Mariannaea sp. PMI_226]|nr:methyltransferase domain-containing protein [Mariannaea sp. PMI_226]